MKTKEAKAFEKELTSKNTQFKHEDGWVVVQGGNVYLRSLTTLPDNVKFNNVGYVDLRSLTTLPDNVKFNNRGGVDLDSLTTLPDNVKFNNGGGVDLRSLTTLPDNVKFNNGGYVDLDSLTTLPDNVKFNNGGGVYLSNLTTLPDNVKFNNGDYVYLNSLTTETVTCRGEVVRIKHIDGYTMLIDHERKVGDTTIYKARYFGGGDLKDLKKCFIAKRGYHYAHGKTSREAVDDVNFKHLQSSLSLTDIIAEVKKTKAVTLNQYRLLTGACREGCHHFMDQNNIPRDVESLPLDKVLEMTVGRFGGNRMKELFS